MLERKATDNLPDLVKSEKRYGGREKVIKLPGQRTFQKEGTATANALKQEHA